MPLWDTLYRWLCHHGTPLDVDGYIINENSKVKMLGSKGPNEAKRAQIQNGNESQQNTKHRQSQRHAISRILTQCSLSLLYF